MVWTDGSRLETGDTTGAFAFHQRDNPVLKPIQRKRSAREARKRRPDVRGGAPGHPDRAIEQEME